MEEEWLGPYTKGSPSSLGKRMILDEERGGLLKKSGKLASQCDASLSIFSKNVSRYCIVEATKQYIFDETLTNKYFTCHINSVHYF